MPSYFADSGDLREGDAASAFDGLEPQGAVEAVPESTTPIALLPCSSASERKKRSIGMWGTDGTAAARPAALPWKL